MWVSKESRLIGSSPVGFEDAARQVVERANRTLRGITGVVVLERSVAIAENGDRDYQIELKLLFDVAEPEGTLHW